MTVNICCCYPSTYAKKRSPSVVFYHPNSCIPKGTLYLTLPKRVHFVKSGTLSLTCGGLRFCLNFLLYCFSLGPCTAGNLQH